MKAAGTFTILFETPEPNCTELKKELSRLGIATGRTARITHNGYYLYWYTAPVYELVILLELFWDMDKEEAEDYILSAPN